MSRSVVMRSRWATAGLMLLPILILVVGLFATATPSMTSARAPSSPIEGPKLPVIDAGRPWVQPPHQRTHGVTEADPEPEQALPRSRPESIARATSPAPAVEALTATPAPQIRLVGLEAMYLDVWNADERHYAISGTTPDLLVASAKASIPPDPSGAARHTMAYAGPIVWQHLPSYVVDPATGGCTMTGVASTVRYQATVPVWTSPSSVPPELVAWWQQVQEHIRVHEGEHIRIFETYVSVLPGRVSGQPCGSWEAIVNAWSAEIEAAQVAFDAAEAGWQLPLYAGPLGG